jgi:hypothetical protein
MNAGDRHAFTHGKVTQRGLRADGVPVQQTEKEQAQPQDAPESC